MYEVCPILWFYYDQQVVHWGVISQTHLSQPCMEEMTDVHQVDDSTWHFDVFRWYKVLFLRLRYIVYFILYIFFVIENINHIPRHSSYHHDVIIIVIIKNKDLKIAKCSFDGSPCFQGTRPDFSAVLIMQKRVRFITPAGRKTFLFPSLYLCSRWVKMFAVMIAKAALIYRTIPRLTIHHLSASFTRSFKLHFHALS